MDFKQKIFMIAVCLFALQFCSVCSVAIAMIVDNGYITSDEMLSTSLMWNLLGLPDLVPQNHSLAFYVRKLDKGDNILIGTLNINKSSFEKESSYGRSVQFNNADSIGSMRTYGIDLSGVSQQDEGNYSCEYLIDGEVQASKDIRLYVFSRPTTPQIQADGSPMIGSVLILHCVGMRSYMPNDMRLPLTTKWFHNGNTLHGVTEDTLSLVITEKSLDDVYTCVREERESNGQSEESPVYKIKLDNGQFISQNPLHGHYDQHHNEDPYHIGHAALTVTLLVILGLLVAVGVAGAAIYWCNKKPNLHHLKTTVQCTGTSTTNTLHNGSRDVSVSTGCSTDHDPLPDENYQRNFYESVHLDDSLDAATVLSMQNSKWRSLMRGSTFSRDNWHDDVRHSPELGRATGCSLPITREKQELGDYDTISNPDTLRRQPKFGFSRVSAAIRNTHHRISMSHARRSRNLEPHSSKNIASKTNDIPMDNIPNQERSVGAHGAPKQRINGSIHNHHRIAMPDYEDAENVRSGNQSQPVFILANQKGVQMSGGKKKKWDPVAEPYAVVNKNEHGAVNGMRGQGHERKDSSEDICLDNQFYADA